MSPGRSPSIECTIPNAEIIDQKIVVIAADKIAVGISLQVNKSDGITRLNGTCAIDIVAAGVSAGINIILDIGVIFLTGAQKKPAAVCTCGWLGQDNIADEMTENIYDNKIPVGVN